MCEFEFAVVAIFRKGLMHDPKYKLLEQFTLRGRNVVYPL